MDAEGLALLKELAAYESIYYDSQTDMACCNFCAADLVFRYRSDIDLFPHKSTCPIYRAREYLKRIESR